MCDSEGHSSSTVVKGHISKNEIQRIGIELNLHLDNVELAYTSLQMSTLSNTDIADSLYGYDVRQVLGFCTMKVCAKGQSRKTA